MHPARQVARLPPDHQIIKRRESEQKRAELEAGLRQVDRFTSIARWEQQSGSAIERQKVRGIFKEHMQEHAADLHRRRKLLAALLEDERRMYEQEFLASFETPEQRVARMAEKAKQIKLEKENKRLALAERCYKQRDRLAQDEMRQQQSQMWSAKVAKDREQQIEEKIMMKERKAKEDEEFAREWLESIDEKRKREELEMQAASHRDNDMKTVLDTQVKDLHARKELQEKEIEEQRRKWREEWHREEEQAKLDLIRKEEEQRLARLAVQQENLARAEKRHAEKALETEMDRFLLKQQLAKHQEEEELRKHQRAELLKAQTEFKEHVKAMAVKEARDESELERLRFEESEKEWLKREARWSKEAAEREALMTEVNRVRELQIAERQRIASEQRQQDQEYIAAKKQEDALQEEILRQKERDLQNRHKISRNLLEEQIREKQRLAQIDRQRELLIDKRAQRYTEEFTAKIEALRKEAEENDTILDQFPRRTMQWN